MARGMPKLGQVQDSTNDVQVQQRSVILAFVAKHLGLVQMVSYGLDPDLDVLLTRNSLEDGRRPASGHETKRPPIVLGLLYFCLARSMPSAEALREDQCDKDRAPRGSLLG